jgi:hypothetical protein
MNGATRRAEGARDRDFAADERERLLNAAIVEADLGASFEEYLDIFDRFYGDEFEAVFEETSERIVGKTAAEERLASFLVPLHITAEVCGMSVSIDVSPIAESVGGQTRSAWTITAVGASGATCTRTWRTVRTWRNGQVVTEYYHDSTQAGDALTAADLWPKTDNPLPWCPG